MKMEMLKIALKHIAKVCSFRAPAMQCNEDGNVNVRTPTLIERKSISSVPRQCSAMKIRMLKIALKHIVKVCFFHAPAMQCNEDENVKDCTQTHSESLFLPCSGNAVQ